MDMFLQMLWSNFASHKHLSPRGNSDQVNDAVSFLDTWINHPDPTQRQTENNDPSKGVSSIREAKDPCIENFELFVNRVQKLYGSKDRGLKPATKAMQEYQQLPNKSV